MLKLLVSLLTLSTLTSLGLPPPVLQVHLSLHPSSLATLFTILPPLSGGLGGSLNIPLVSDLNHKMSEDYGALYLDAGHTLRATYIIDPEVSFFPSLCLSLSFSSSLLDGQYTYLPLSRIPLSSLFRELSVMSPRMTPLLAALSLKC